MEVEQFLERIRIALKVWLPDLAKENIEHSVKFALQINNESF